MEPSKLIVTLGALAFIIWTVWFFFLSERKKTTASMSEAEGVQTLKITVKGGYEPDTVVVEQGKPVRLDFYRDETSSCSDTVVFGDFGISRKLPAFQTTSVEFTPEKTGEFAFTCGMNMLRGKLIVERKRRPSHAKERAA